MTGIVGAAEAIRVDLSLGDSESLRRADRTALALLTAAREAEQALEAILELHTEIIGSDGEHTEECSTCESWEWPCDSHRHAVAALVAVRGDQKESGE